MSGGLRVGVGGCVSGVVIICDRSSIQGVPKKRGISDYLSFLSKFTRNIDILYLFGTREVKLYIWRVLEGMRGS